MLLDEVSHSEHCHSAELTDANWEAVLKTGTDDPDAPALPDETVWAIEVYAHDQSVLKSASAHARLTALTEQNVWSFPSGLRQDSRDQLVSCRWKIAREDEVRSL